MDYYDLDIEEMYGTQYGSCGHALNSDTGGCFECHEIKVVHIPSNWRVKTWWYLSINSMLSGISEWEAINE